jgi:TolA-binding protein
MATTSPEVLTKKATEAHFEAGWRLLKSGRNPEAARELALAADAGGSLAADARYFQAVALIRAGRKTEAEHALVVFLDHAPDSLRRGHAEVMLAKLIAERGDTQAARLWLEEATHDADPDVVFAARAALAGLRLP